ncbi:hypothetical protein [Dictyobacter arantiisoli]|uniref:Uncharacterized protein n=1 Tax=Dictyobacter arantiisoli TaxID=2014874 RepID=A0A5A5T6J3_9CHLR|nr:hypothetical protein [Dictyobacter arantiisoli]GCF06796.1 hypothetical protein KDI_03600 [Dictyobacter arantiisoli]
MKELLHRYYLRAIDKVSLYVTPAAKKDVWRARLEQAMDTALIRLRQGPEAAQKPRLVVRIFVLLMCGLLGFYLLLTTHQFSSFSSTKTGTVTAIAALATPTHKASTAASTSPSYRPGKGGVEQATTIKSAQQAQKAYADVTCDINKTPNDYALGSPGNTLGGCHIKTDQYDCNYSPIMDAQIATAPPGTPPTYKFDCTFNGKLYDCPFSNFSIIIGNITCNYSGGEHCTIAECPLVGQTCATVDNANPVTGLPQPTPPASSTNGTTAAPDNKLCAVPVPIDCTTIAVGATDVLQGNTGLLTSTPAAATYQSAAVTNSWTTMLSIVGALLAFMLVLAGYQVLLGPYSARYVTSSEALGRVIMILVAAVASLWMTGLLIEVMNGLSTFFKGFIFGTGTPIGVPSARWGCNVKQLFGNIYNLSIYNLQVTNQQITADQHSKLVFMDMAGLINHISDYILTILTVVLALQLMIRLIFLNGYIIMTPLMFFCGALPGNVGSGIMRAWIKEFLALIAVQFFQLFATGILAFLFEAAQPALGSSTYPGQLFAKIAPILCMIVILGVPRLLNSSATNLLSTMSSSMSGAMTGIILIVRGL